MHAAAPAELIQCRIDDRGEAGRVAYVTVNNPDKRNALGMPGKRAIAQTFGKLAKDDRLRVAVITGAGEKSFIAGADIAEMKDLDADQALIEHSLTHVASGGATLDFEHSGTGHEAENTQGPRGVSRRTRRTAHEVADAWP